jgi:hypothetical protein
MLHIIWLADADEKIQILFRSISRRFRSDVYVRGIGLSRHQPIPNKQTIFPHKHTTNERRRRCDFCGRRLPIGLGSSAQPEDNRRLGIRVNKFGLNFKIGDFTVYRFKILKKIKNIKKTRINSEKVKIFFKNNIV